MEENQGAAAVVKSASDYLAAEDVLDVPLPAAEADSGVPVSDMTPECEVLDLSVFSPDMRATWDDED